jgi:carbamoyl-phosphate synthase large subunit
VLLRPSYVLGGRAMEIVDSEAQLDNYVATAVNVSGDSPVLIDQYLRDAIECDVDALCDGEQVVVAGVMQHIEEAGVHSATAPRRFRPTALSDDIIAEMERQAEALALALGVVGLMNVQFAVKDGTVYLIEVNPRASRTCRSSPRPSACRSPRSRRGSWPARSSPTCRRSTGGSIT